MKKNYFNIAAIALLATTTIYTGCKKEDDAAKPAPVTTTVVAPKDSIAPTIALIGSNNVTISLQGLGAYTELGATAQDAKDGQLVPIITGNVDENLIGSYILTYTAKDSAGNIATVTRTITVVNDAAGLAGTYNCTIAGSPAHTYTQTVTASTFANNRILFERFKDVTFSSSYLVYADVVGSSLNIPNQTIVISSTEASQFGGTGTLLGSPASISLSYNETIYVSGSASSPTAYTETLTKQ